MTASKLSTRAEMVFQRHVSPAQVPVLKTPAFDLMTQFAFIARAPAVLEQSAIHGDARWFRTSAALLRSGMRPETRITPASGQRLAGRRDKQIAAELGLSAYGVRYHLRNLFAKLGARNRAEALRRAREMGLIADDS